MYGGRWGAVWHESVLCVWYERICDSIWCDVVCGCYRLLASVLSTHSPLLSNRPICSMSPVAAALHSDRTCIEKATHSSDKRLDLNRSGMKISESSIPSCGYAFVMIRGKLCLLQAG